MGFHLKTKKKTTFMHIRIFILKCYLNLYNFVDTSYWNKFELKLAHWSCGKVKQLFSCYEKILQITQNSTKRYMSVFSVEIIIPQSVVMLLLSSVRWVTNENRWVSREYERMAHRLGKQDEVFVYFKNFIVFNYSNLNF